MGASLQSVGTNQPRISTYRWTVPPFASEEQVKLVDIVINSQPVDHQLSGYGWTLKKLRQWLINLSGRPVSRNTLRTILKQAGLSWKKCKKLLSKANAARRAEFVAQFERLYEQMCQGEVRLIYIDESHFHQDLDLGYSWGRVGQPLWRESHSPPLSARLNWYGAYDFSRGRCLIEHYGKCNGEHTLKFLDRLADWLDPDDRQTIIIWDGASYHRAKIVQARAAQLGFTLLPLPGYSPDLNPIEGLWKWMRQEVTQHFCHASLSDLFDDCLAFVDQINLDPVRVITRLWPKFELDPVYEKLLVSS